MENTSPAALHSYTSGVNNIIGYLASSAVLFCIHTVLAIISARHLIHRNIKRPSAALMFGGLLIIYASTTMHVVTVVMYSVGYIHAATAHFPQIVRTNSYIASSTVTINMTIGDAIVWWRAYVLWQRKSIIILGTVFQAALLGLAILSIVFQGTEIDDDDQLHLRFSNVYGIVSMIGSLLTNVIATLLIGWKAWEHRKVLLLAQGGSTLKRRWITPVMRILILLVESGTIYSALLAGIIVYAVYATWRHLSSLSPPSDGEAKFLLAMQIFVAGCIPQIVAIYPMAIIVIVTLNKSPIEGSLGRSNIVGHSIAFRDGRSDVHVSLRDDTARHNECTLDNGEEQSTNSEESASQEHGVQV